MTRVKKSFGKAIAFSPLVLIFLGAVSQPGGCSATSRSREMDNPAPAQTELRLPVTERHYRVGVGPIPRNFPGSSQTDWLDMFAKAKECAELVTAQNEWRDAPARSGEIPEILKLVASQKGTYGYEPVFGINFFRGEGAPDLATGLNSENSWNNHDAREKYTATALAICKAYNPAYLGLGIEVNTYYQHHPEDMDRFVEFYKSLYDAIKRDYPGVKVFVTFQLEKTKGIGNKTWGVPVRSAQWDLIDKFGDKLDLAVFTSYPEVEFNSPKDIPDDYYSSIQQHVTKPVAFAEIGWSSNKSTEADESAFLTRFVGLTKDMNIEFANWAFLHDLKSSGPLTKIGLRKSNGDAKTSWSLWKQLKNTPYKKAR